MNLDKYFEELGVTNNTDKVLSITHKYVRKIIKYRFDPSEKWQIQKHLDYKFYYKGTPEFDKLWKKIISNKFKSYSEPRCYTPIMNMYDESNIKYIYIPLKGGESYHINYKYNESRK